MFEHKDGPSFQGIKLGKIQDIPIQMNRNDVFSVISRSYGVLVLYSLTAMGNCNSVFLMSVKTEGEDISYLQSICHMGSVYELMEVSLFVKNSELLIHKYDDRRQCTHIVAMYNTADAVVKMSLLVKMRADLRAPKAKSGDSLLHIAFKRKNYELAEWLLQESESIGAAINYQLQIPYHLAYYARDQKMMDVLRNNGAACDDPVDSEASDDACFDYFL